MFSVCYSILFTLLSGKTEMSIASYVTFLFVDIQTRDLEGNLFIFSENTSFVTDDHIQIEGLVVSALLLSGTLPQLQCDYRGITLKLEHQIYHS